LQAIVSEAFNPTAGICGTAAGTLAMTFLWGVKRGLFSNEAGQGSAPIAHAAAKTDEPVREGLVALLGPLIDTLIICTMTALVVIIAGHWDEPIEETRNLHHKDVKVYTWVEGEELTLAGFGDAAGYRESPGRIEAAGYAGATGDGQVDKGAATEEILVIRDGRPHRIRHHDGTETAAILIVNEAPILFQDGGHLILENGSPWSGEVTVSGGSLTDAAKAKVSGVTVTGRMVKTGQDLTAYSFQSTLGGFGTIMVTLAVVLFGLSTAISWSYYGDRCTEFLFGIRAVLVYRCVFLFFVYLGAVLPLQMVWDLGDLALGLMTIPNLIAIFALSGVVRSMQDEYYSREHKRTR
jgi:AGCS family alanine or glycine:cation symporter